MTSPYGVRFRQEVLEEDPAFFRDALGREAFAIFRRNLEHNLEQTAKDPLGFGKEGRCELAGWLVGKFFIGAPMRKRTPAGRIVYAVGRERREVLVEVIWFRPTSASEDASRLINALEKAPDSPYYLAKRRLQRNPTSPEWPS